MTVVASKHKASKHKSAIDKPLNSSKMLHRNVSLFGSLEDFDVFKVTRSTQFTRTESK